MPNAESLLKYVNADIEVDKDVLTVNVPKSYSSFKDDIRSKRKELQALYKVRKVRVKDKKKSAKPKEVIDYSRIDVKILDSITDELVQLVNDNEYMALDFETTSTDGMTCDIVSVGLTFCNNLETFYIPVTHTEGKNVPLEVVTEFLKYAQDKVKFVVHNLSFEKKILDRINIHPEYLDTMIFSYLKGGLLKHGLKHVAKERLNVNMKTYEDIVGKDGKKQIKFADVDVDTAAQYCGSDTLYTAKLLDLLKNDIDNDLITLDHNAAVACSNMEARGVLVDVEYLKTLERKYQSILDRIEQRMFKAAGCELNLRSPKQLRKVLFEDMGLEPLKGRKYWTKTGPSTNKDVMKALFIKYPENKLLQYMNQFRSLSVYLNSFVRKMLELKDDNNILRGSFLYARTTTGRLASSDPNMQNLPGRGLGRFIRGGIIAPKGYTVVAGDYSQIEYRILADLMKDEKLIQMIKDGHDVHSATASLMFKTPIDKVTKQQRDAGKTLGFGLVYGRGANAVAADLKVSVKQAKKFTDMYFKELPNFLPLRQLVWDSTEELGYSETLTGRRRYIPGMRSTDDYIRTSSERQAFNAVIQGSAADMIRVAMHEVEKLDREFDCKLVMSVHDELVFYVKDEQVEDFKIRLAEVMEVDRLGDYKFSVPIKVDIGQGKNYLEAK